MNKSKLTMSEDITSVDGADRELQDTRDRSQHEVRLKTGNGSTQLIKGSKGMEASENEISFLDGVRVAVKLKESSST